MNGPGSDTGGNRIPSPAAHLSAGAAFYALGALMVIASPVFVGMVAERLSLSPAEIGFVVGAEASGGIVASLTGPLWLTRLSARHVALFGIVVMVAGALLTASATGFTDLLLIRSAFSILGAGPVYALSIPLLARLPDPHRAFAIAGGAQALVPALVMVILPWTSAGWGFGAAMVVLAVVLASGLLFLGGVPAWPAGRSEAAPLLGGGMRSVGGLRIPLLLFTVFSLVAGTQAFWAFSERIGDAKGIGAEGIGAALGAATLFGIFGSLAAALSARHMSSRTQFVAGCVACAIGPLVILVDTTRVGFVAAAFLIFFASVFATIFQLAAIAEWDPTGRTAVLVPATQSLGVIAGPVLTGFVVGDGDFARAALVAVAFFTATALVFAIATRGRPVPGPVPGTPRASAFENAGGRP